MKDKKDDIEVRVSMAGIGAPADADTGAPEVATVKISDTSIGAQDEEMSSSAVDKKGDEGLIKGAAEESTEAEKSGEAELDQDSTKEDAGEKSKKVSEESKEEQTSTKKKSVGGKKVKKSEKEKKEHQKISIKDIPALLFPEHLGDIFMIFVILALALGAGAFWFLAWIPTNEPPTAGPQESIMRFSEEELQEIIEILDSREEASKAPVNPPARDPFSD